MITYQRLAMEAGSLGMRPESLAKIETVRQAGLDSLDVMRRPGCRWRTAPTCWARCTATNPASSPSAPARCPPIDVLRSATTLAAKLCGLEGRAGVIEPGADADLLVVDGNPLRDWSLLEGQGAHLSAIMQAGVWRKNALR